MNEVGCGPSQPDPTKDEEEGEPQWSRSLGHGHPTPLDVRPELVGQPAGDDHELELGVLRLNQLPQCAIVASVLVNPVRDESDARLALSALGGGWGRCGRAHRRASPVRDASMLSSTLSS
jgi:hypothetical protein